MGFGAKVFVTAAISMILVAFIVAVDQGDRGSSDSRASRGGGRDPFRRLIMSRDGTLRKYAKLGVVLFLTAFLGALWLLA